VTSPSSVAVMSGLALEVAVNRWLKPAFEAASPYRLEIDWRPTTAIMKSIAEGQRADVVIAIDGSMDKLCADRIVRPETRVCLADSILGVGVREGAPKPDVSTVEAFKRALVAARAVAYSRASPRRSMRAPSRSRWASPARRSRAARPTSRSSR
jgi:molybdate transport system substrate-binding protein